MKKKKQPLLHKQIEMRKTNLLLFGWIAVIIVGLNSCSGVRREPGTIYMPDMAYSRALETYSDHKYLNDQGIYYDATPVAGTVKRGGMAIFPLAKDQGTDTTNYVASKQVANPITQLEPKEFLEAARLYRVNCAICHGEKLDGNGPLYNGGNGPFPIAPRNLIADPVVSKMPEGQMMYSVIYGKNLMGSYASQLNTRQLWMVMHYVKTMQAGSKPAAVPAADTTKKVN